MVPCVVDIVICMQGTFSCPICSKRLRTLNRLTYNKATLTSMPLKCSQLPYTTYNYSERICTGNNHVLQMFVDISNNTVDLLKISLNNFYNRYIFIDYVNSKIKILSYNNVFCKEICLDQLIEPDFPLLTKLKEKVSYYITFS
jgi:hypothetical protein